MLALFRALKYFLPGMRGHHVLVRTDSTSVVSYINHQGGLHSRPLYKLAHQILVWSQDKLLLLRAVHIPGHLNVGADILSRQGQRPKKWILHPEVVKQIWSFWPGSSGPLCYSGDIAMSPLVLSDSPSSPWTGRYGSDLAESSSVLCTLSPRSFCSRESALGDSGESALGRGQPTVGSTVLAGASMVLGPNFSPRRLSMGDSHQEGSPLTGGNLSPPPGAVEAVGVAPERAQLIAFSLSTVWVSSTKALSLRPPVRSRVPTWNLVVVLEAFCKAPFEPIKEISDRLITIKTAFLLAISSLKRVGDLQALSVASAYLDFAPGKATEFLYPRVGYVPKVPSVAPQPIVLQAVCPPPFGELFHWTDYTCVPEHGHAEGVPLAFRRSVSFPSGSHGCIRNLRRFTTNAMVKLWLV